MLFTERRCRSRTSCISPPSSSSRASWPCGRDGLSQLTPLSRPPPAGGRVKMERLVVDGYNVIHAWPTLKRLLGVSLEAARDKLIERLSVYGLVTGADVTVVFDSHQKA